MGILSGAGFLVPFCLVNFRDLECLSISLSFATGAVGNLLLSSQASWDYLNEHVDLIGSNHTVLSVENGRQVRVFQRGDKPVSQLYENTLSVHWWSGNEEQGFTPQLRAFAHRILQGTNPDPEGGHPMTAHAEAAVVQETLRLQQSEYLYREVRSPLTIGGFRIPAV